VILQPGVKGSQFGFRFSTQPCYIWHSKFANYRESSGVRLDSQQLQFTAEPRTGTRRARHARVRVWRRDASPVLTPKTHSTRDHGTKSQSPRAFDATKYDK